MKYVIGLTGGIACGKSVVSDILEKRGINIIDADVVSRAVMQEGHKCYDEVKSAFANCVESGVINRRRLREIVFADKQNLAILNSITHKHIKQEITKLLKEMDTLVVLVVPLMFESGFDKMCNVVINVSSPLNLRIKRLVSRDNISEELALSMINSQMSDYERRNKSDFVIENDGDLEELESQVDNVLKSLKERIL